MSAPPLLPNYVTVRNILDGEVRAHAMVNVVGVVVDYRAPIPTRGNDWKCQIRLYDASVQDDNELSICLNIFRPKNEMPTAGCGDVMLIRSVKVQKYQTEMPSLLTNYETRIAVYTASKIPKPPVGASCALLPPPRPKDRRPDDKENTFVSQMYHSVDKGRVPGEHEFENMVLVSSNVRDKFSVLQDVSVGRFYDIVAQVVKAPYDAGDKMTLWVTDYTENSTFYHYAYNPLNASEGPDGDPWNYTAKYTKPASSSDWPGPFGKLCMQVTCWEPHATAIRETEVFSGTWVMMRNVQIKLGHNGSNQEGFIREDRGASGLKIGIYSLNPAEDPENINPHLKEALRRKRDYERMRKSQLKDINEASKAGQKRKAELASEAEPKLNSRSKRNKKRAKARHIEPSDERPPPVGDLNSNVKCENQDKPTSLVAEMAEIVHHQSAIDGQDVRLKLPFVNTNYRANVRVVNFFPSKLVNFAVPKKESEYDALSDDGGESVSSNDTEDEDGTENTMEVFTATRRWEWRFYLEVEDAAVPNKQKKQRMWVAVDNQAAQCLLKLDASNLRHDKQKVEALRNKLFILWGDLEEHKSREREKQREALEKARKGGPPRHSPEGDEAGPETSKAQVANRPFSCCIQQYGVKVQETDPAKADAGNGRRWQRMYRLFGTLVSDFEVV
ncbi:hypothetical protein FZEAL_8103 [Fusarium zealandicum]|uniref:Protection of telomeres protein 1 n=1 Tax=Fusarium zealandicum TaxID=1053134 RepID=A0A8H4UEH1_9HYPO|nr:hypothetical protein FZEAL_8103 [Fusarium zealandicum]